MLIAEESRRNWLFRFCCHKKNLDRLSSCVFYLFSFWMLPMPLLTLRWLVFTKLLLETGLPLSLGSSSDSTRLFLCFFSMYFPGICSFSSRLLEVLGWLGSMKKGFSSRCLFLLLDILRVRFGTSSSSSSELSSLGPFGICLVCFSSWRRWFFCWDVCGLVSKFTASSSMSCCEGARYSGGTPMS